MNCESVNELADLYLYGELESGQEEELEQHAHGCPACRSSLDRRRALHGRFDALAASPDPALLAQCRRGLFQSSAVARRPFCGAAFSSVF